MKRLAWIFPAALLAIAAFGFAQNESGEENTLIACTDAIVHLQGQLITPLLPADASGLALSADGKTLAAVLSAGFLKVRSLSGEGVPGEFPLLSPAEQVSASDNGSLIACGGERQRSLFLLRRV